MSQQAKVKVGSVTKDDVEFQTFRCGGNGGQNVNKRDTGARCIHHPSGARGESREERTQLLNKRIAFRRMAESKEFRMWTRIQAGIDLSIEAEVAAQMHPSKIRVEVKEGGKWVEKDID